MFSDFIYYIVVLLIYNSYIPTGTDLFPPLDALTAAILLFILFSLSCRASIAGKKKPDTGHDDIYLMEKKLDLRVSIFSVTAVLLFIIYVYVLDLPGLFSAFDIFTRFPTLEALVFIGIYILHRIVIWSCTYEFQRDYTGLSIDRKAYVGSCLSFSIPALMPWFILSFLSDLIAMLPFINIRLFFESTAGELLYLLCLIILISICGPVLIKKFWRCSPLENGFSRSRIEGVLRSAGIRYRDILKWELFGGTMVTAGVMGITGRFRYILVTPALLNRLTPAEVDLVIAHEIGHVKKKHLLFYIFFFITYIAVIYALITPLMLLIYYSEPVTWITRFSGMDRNFSASVLLGILMILFFILFFRFVFGFYMRNFERQADTFVFSMFETARPLISTFYKIAGAGRRSADKPNWHHFSIRDRIGYLEKCEADRTWVARQDSKIKRMIYWYIVCILITGAAGAALNFGSYADSIKHHVSEKILLDRLASLTDRETAMAAAGDYHLSMENYAEAEKAYMRAISGGSCSAHCLNNLAWLYATCEDRRFRKPARALQLALEAVEIEQDPIILDTLATAYFENGLYQMAVKTELKAISLAGPQADMYKGQLEKFKDAAENSEPDRRPGRP